MEKEYIVPALGVDVTARRRDDSSAVVFYNAKGFVAAFDAADGGMVTTKSKLENLSDLDFVKTLCGFAAEFVLGGKKGGEDER